MGSALLRKREHELFCIEYAKDGNGAQAYMRTYGGDNPASARAAAARLLAIGSVSERALYLVGQLREKVMADAEKVVSGIARVAFMDPRKAFDPKGNLLPIHQLPDEVALSIAGLEIFEEYEGKGVDRVLTGYTKKIKFNDRLGALANLGKHFKLFTEKVEMTGPNGGAIPVQSQESPEQRAALSAVSKRLSALESRGKK